MRKLNAFLFSSVLLFQNSTIICSWYYKPLQFLGYVSSFLIPASKREVKRFRTENSKFIQQRADELEQEIKTKAENLDAKIIRLNKRTAGLNADMLSLQNEQKKDHEALLNKVQESAHQFSEQESEWSKKTDKAFDELIQLKTQLNNRYSKFVNEENELKKQLDKKNDAIARKSVFNELKLFIIRQKLQTLRNQKKHINHQLENISRDLKNFRESNDKLQRQVSVLEEAHTELAHALKFQKNEKDEIQKKVDDSAEIYSEIMTIMNQKVIPGMGIINDEMAEIKKQHELLGFLIQQKKLVQKNKNTIDENIPFGQGNLFKSSSVGRALQVTRQHREELLDD